MSAKKTAIELYAETSTIHGISVFFEKEKLILKIFWTIFFFASLGMGIYQIYMTIQRFHQEPTATLISEKSLSQFPTVAVCPTIWLDLPKLYKQRTDVSAIRYGLGLLNVKKEDSLAFSSLFDPHMYGHALDTATLASMAEKFTQFKSNRSLASVLHQFAIQDPKSVMSVKCKGCQNSTVEPMIEVRDKGICYGVQPGPLQMSTWSDPELTLQFTIGMEMVHAYCGLHWIMRKTAGLPFEETEEAKPIVIDSVFMDKFIALMKDDFWAWMDMFYDWLKNQNDKDPNWEKEIYFDVVEQLLQESFAIYLQTGDAAMKKLVQQTVKLQGGRDYSVFLRVIKREGLINAKKCKTPEQLQETDLRDCYQMCSNEKMLDCYEKNGQVGQHGACIWYTGERQDFNNGSYCNILDEIVAGEKMPENVPFIACAYKGDHCSHPRVPCLPPCSATYAEPSILPSKPKDLTSIRITITPMHPQSILILEEIWTYTWDDLYSNIGGLMGLSIGASMLSFAHVFYHFCLHPWVVWREERKKP